MSLQKIETGHVGLNVTDLKRSRSFYTEVFGFDVIGGSEDGERRYLFLGHDGKILLTLWQQSQGRFNKDLPGLHHLSFRVDSVADVERIEREIRRRDLTVYYDGISVHSEGSQSGGVFFEDPDGTRLEVFAPDVAEKASGSAGHGPACGFF